MATPEEVPEGVVQVPIIWVGVEDLPVHFVNQYVGVVQPNEIFLMFGSLVPPAIIGETDEERKMQAESIQFVQVKPVARLGFTPARLRELIGVLEKTMSNYEKLPSVGPGTEA